VYVKNEHIIDSVNEMTDWPFSNKTEIIYRLPFTSKLIITCSLTCGLFTEACKSEA